jgi:hypothetical protein
MGWAHKIYAATINLGVYLTDNFVDPSGQPIWTAINNGLADLHCVEFHVDPFHDADRQYVITGDGLFTNILYRRYLGGAWEEILTTADIVALVTQDTVVDASIKGFCTDPSIDGRLWAVVVISALVNYPNNPAYLAFYSDDYGDTWNYVTPIYWAIFCYGLVSIRACGDSVWVPAITAAGANQRVYTSINKGATWASAIVDGVFASYCACAINPLSPTYVYANVLDYQLGKVVEGGVAYTVLNDDFPLEDYDTIWFDPVDQLHQRLLRANILYATANNWATSSNNGAIDLDPYMFAPWAGSDIDYMLVGITIDHVGGKYHAVGTLNGEADTTPVGISGTNCGVAPYTNSIPDTCGGLCRNGLYGIFPEAGKVYTNAVAMLGYSDTGLLRGIPMAGDRSAFDALNYPLRHTDDIDAPTGIHHTEAGIIDIIEDHLPDHDHSGDVGDGGTFDAANLTSDAADDGDVLTADGIGGAAWEPSTGGALSALDIRKVGHGMFLTAAHSNNVDLGDERCTTLLSMDGIDWTVFGTNPINANFIRDPAIMHYDGKWWIVCNDNFAYQGLYYSSDLITWSAKIQISTIIGGVSPTSTWAPSWFIDDDDSVHVFTELAFGGGDFDIYEIHPTNRAMTTWSEPALVGVTGYPDNPIDPFVTRIGDTYYMFYKNNGTSYVCLGTSTSLLSGWTTVGSGNWAGWGSGIEGPSLMQMDDGRWRLYFTNNAGLDAVEIYYSETTDSTLLSGWSAKVALHSLDNYNHPMPMRIVGTLDLLERLTLILNSFSSASLIDPTTDVGDMIYRDSPGTNIATLALGADATASSVWGGFVADNAIDENDATQWCSTNPVTGAWIKIDLGSSQTFGSFRFHQHGGATNKVYTLLVETSPDNATWTSQGIYTVAFDDARYNLPTSVTARYVKFTALSGGIGGTVVMTIEVNVGFNGLTRLPIGAEDEVLTVTSGLPTWEPAAGGAMALDDLTDVNAPAPADQDVLTWDDGAGEWIPQAAPAGGGGGGDSITDPVFHVGGALVATPDVNGVYICPRAGTITAVYIYCRDPGSAGSTIIDVNLNGTSIFDVTPANQPELAWNDANQVAKSGVPDTTAVVENDVLSIDIDQVATDAKDLTVVIAMAVSPPNGWNVTNAMTYASADDPTYTATMVGDFTTIYQAGQKIQLTQATGGTKYFIITKVAYGAPNTTLTLYGGTDYNLENEAITNPYYSMMKAPFGFPLDPTKWMVEVKDTNLRTQATPAQNTWYNVDASHVISIPIGAWHVSYQACGQFTDATAGTWIILFTLSTANNSESDADFSSRISGGSIVTLSATLAKTKYLMLAAKTAYYLNMETRNANLDNMYVNAGGGTTILRAVCAYL